MTLPLPLVRDPAAAQEAKCGKAAAIRVPPSLWRRGRRSGIMWRIRERWISMSVLDAEAHDGSTALMLASRNLDEAVIAGSATSRRQQ